MAISRSPRGCGFALCSVVVLSGLGGPGGEARLATRRQPLRRTSHVPLRFLPWNFNDGDSGTGFVASTEQHNEELLLRHGFIQRQGGAPARDQVAVTPLTLALDKDTGELAVVPSEDVAPASEHATLCHLPEGLRKKPLQAIAMAHALIYALDLLEHLAAIKLETADRKVHGSVVVVGVTALSRCLIPIIAELGFQVIVVAPSPGDAEVAMKLGATRTLLRDDDPPFCKVVPQAVAFVDAIGKIAMSRSLAPTMRGRYFCVTPVPISEAVSSGALKGVTMGLGLGFLTGQKDLDKADAKAAWTPAPEAQDRIAQVVGVMGESPKDHLRARISYVLPEIASWKDYGQALTWPKDPESGVLYGFDASISERLRTSGGWGVAELTAEDLAPPPPREPRPSVKDVANTLLKTASDFDDAEAQGERDAAEVSTTAAARSPRSLSDGVHELDTIEEAAELISQTPTPSILLVGGRWCRACRYCSGQFKSVAEQFPDIQFFEYRAHSKSEPLRAKLGVSAVPTMLLNRNGQTIHQSSFCSDSAVIAEDVESWLS